VAGDVTGSRVLGRLEHAWFHPFRFAWVAAEDQNLINAG
jgi:hypothetical protein